MSRRTKHIIAIFELILLIAIVAFALCPRTLGQALGRGFDWESTSHVLVQLDNLGPEKISTDLTLTPGEDACQQVIDQLTSVRYTPVYLDGSNDSTEAAGERITVIFVQTDGTKHGLRLSKDSSVTWFFGDDRRDKSYHAGKWETFWPETYGLLTALAAPSGLS